MSIPKIVSLRNKKAKTAIKKPYQGGIFFKFVFNIFFLHPQPKFFDIPKIPVKIWKTHIEAVKTGKKSEFVLQRSDLTIILLVLETDLCLVKGKRTREFQLKEFLNNVMWWW